MLTSMLATSFESTRRRITLRSTKWQTSGHKWRRQTTRRLVSLSTRMPSVPCDAMTSARTAPSSMEFGSGSGRRLLQAGRIVKGRPWKHELSSRSSTATRLSQRLILASATNGTGKSLESWDIAGAFLKGLTYQELWKALKELGVQCVERMIAIVPPRNAWRHLKKAQRKVQHQGRGHPQVRPLVP